jgi:hypothetical protein
MQVQQNLPEAALRYHTSKIKGKLDELITHLREEVTKVDEPKAQALFETTALSIERTCNCLQLSRAAFKTSVEIV